MEGPEQAWGPYVFGGRTGQESEIRWQEWRGEFMLQKSYREVNARRFWQRRQRPGCKWGKETLEHYTGAAVPRILAEGCLRGQGLGLRV